MGIQELEEGSRKYKFQWLSKISKSWGLMDSMATTVNTAGW